ncbi:unnamed protein product [Linum trigynum]|uniref:Uncharacterized protein n=1 Tax=Linum trigynum TaxID=586398 RepID=A0AAV2ERJ5_9ROSI
MNQRVAHHTLALELLHRLLENPSDDGVELAVAFLTECGALLHDLSPRGLAACFDRLRDVLHEGEIDKRVQFLIEGMFAIRKANFRGYRRFTTGVIIYSELCSLKSFICNYFW